MGPQRVEEDEFDNITDLHASKCAKVHGVVSSLPPMKMNKAGTSKYFYAELTDGKRVVGFDAKTNQKLSAF